MRLTIDRSANAAYLRLSEDKGEVTTIAVADDLNVDVGSDGKVRGIEFLNLDEQVLGGHEGKLVVADAFDETPREYPLASDGGHRRARAR